MKWRVSGCARLDGLEEGGGEDANGWNGPVEGWIDGGDVALRTGMSSGIGWPVGAIVRVPEEASPERECHGRTSIGKSVQ